mmetsp:Transcript_15585/g.37190  ORF Transcript_15585/g.37190 Transcript_15585/m.37190 type:complete len:214 (-) Transcript_15585:363-1004(-)
MECLFVLDYLQCHVLLGFQIQGLDDDTKGSFAKRLSLANSITSSNFLAEPWDVISILIIVAIVEGRGIFLAAGTRLLLLASLLCVVHVVDPFVRLQQIDCELPQRIVRVRFGLRTRRCLGLRFRIWHWSIRGRRHLFLLPFCRTSQVNISRGFTGLFWGLVPLGTCGLVHIHRRTSCVHLPCFIPRRHNARRRRRCRRRRLHFRSRGGIQSHG